MSTARLLKQQDLRASKARAAIDNQHGPREHVHRDLRAIERQPEERIHIAESYEKAKDELADALVKYNNARDALSSANRVGYDLHRYLPASQYAALRSEATRTKNLVLSLQRKVQELNRKRRGLAATHKTLPEWFIQIAETMLEPAVFCAIKEAAREKVASVNRIANGSEEP